VKRRVLIVTPFFAPQSHAAVFRAYKLAKYLPSLGWQPHVVTVDANYGYNEDEQLLLSLPAEVQVHRARYVEPSPRGIGFATGLNDKRFITLKGQGVFDIRPSNAPGGAARPSMSARLARGVRQALRAPDAYWPWFLPALELATQIAKQYDIPLVMTSADPYTCHALGLALQQRGLRWVADLRDPHTHCHHTSSRSSLVFALQRRLERGAAERADAVTVAARSIALILKENYALRDDSRLHFIPTGLDPALLGDARPHVDNGDPYLIFAGEYLPDYGEVLFRLFAEALRDPRLHSSRYRLRIVGRREVNEPRVWPAVERYGLTGRVEIIDHVPQQQLYGLIRGAHFAVLCYGENARWWCLPAKLVDYQALRKPVLAIVPNPSEARARLSETRLGVFLDGAGAAQTLVEALLAGSAGHPPNEQECQRYEATSQVRAFAEVFESVLQR
jgi:hypothetical protein